MPTGLSSRRMLHDQGYCREGIIGVMNGSGKGEWTERQGKILRQNAVVRLLGRLGRDLHEHHHVITGLWFFP